MQAGTKFSNQRPATRSGLSILAILRRRWWLIGLIMLGAVLMTLVVSLNAPLTYRSSLRLQALALDDQEVALYTRRSTGAASDQIALTQFNFNETLQNSLIAWRTIDDLDLDMSASQLLSSLTTSAAGDFVSVTYDATSPQQAMDVLNRHVDNALAYYNTMRSRPASVSGQFVNEQMNAQGQTLKKAQDALLQFQLEHNVGDLQREINAVQDELRNLRIARDAAVAEAAQADALIAQYNAQADETQTDLAAAQQALTDLLGRTPNNPTLAQQVQLDTQTDQVNSLRQAQRDQRNAANSQRAIAAGQRALAAQQETQINQRSGDLAQLIGLSSDYNALEADLETAQADYEFLRSKAAEARLKEAQAVNVGSLQIVEPAFLPTEPGTSPALQLALLVALVSLLVGVVLAMLLEFINPTPVTA